MTETTYMRDATRCACCRLRGTKSKTMARRFFRDTQGWMLYANRISERTHFRTLQVLALGSSNPHEPRKPNHVTLETISGHE